MGMGHVPAGPVRQERQSDDLPRREHRRARANLRSVALAKGLVEPPALHRNTLGRFGECVAAVFLQHRGATIVQHNSKVGRGELDLIVRIEGELAAVEVKTGSGASDPIYHFDEAKRRQVRSLASQRGLRRIDYVGVTVSCNGVMVHWLPRIA